MTDGDDTLYDVGGHTPPSNDNAEHVDARLLDLVFDLLSLAPDTGYAERELHDAAAVLERQYMSADITLAIRTARRSGFAVLRGNGRIYLERRTTPRQLKFVRGLISALASTGRQGPT